jgi:hypothetical protein
MHQDGRLAALVKPNDRSVFSSRKKLSRRAVTRVMCGDEELGGRAQSNRGSQFKLKLASKSEDG